MRTKEENTKYAREWRRKNPEKTTAYRRKWQKENKDKLRE